MVHIINKHWVSSEDHCPHIFMLFLLLICCSTTAGPCCLYLSLVFSTHRPVQNLVREPEPAPAPAHNLAGVKALWVKRNLFFFSSILYRIFNVPFFVCVFFRLGHNKCAEGGGNARDWFPVANGASWAARKYHLYKYKKIDGIGKKYQPCLQLKCCQPEASNAKICWIFQTV